MPENLVSHHEIVINAPAPVVWEALTQPELIKQWFFGVDTETDWTVGSAIVHRGEYQGKPYVDKGKVLVFEAPTALAYSHWSEGSGLADAEANYQRVHFTLTTQHGATMVSLHEENLPSEQGKQISDQAWPMELAKLKQVAEGASGRGGSAGWGD